LAAEKEVAVKHSIAGLTLFWHFILSVVLVQCSAQGTENSRPPKSPLAPEPIIYVMPNAFAIPGMAEGSAVMVESAHNGKEPQVAKIYQELQHRKECRQFSENIDNTKADYFLLLQHGGGVGNRWTVSNKEGTVLASGQSIRLGNSVRDACLAIAKDWRRRPSEQKSSLAIPPKN
jgi:hypothetical protein